MQEEETPSKLDKREAILQATLEVMAEYGFDNAPMSLISKRSKASPGIIYHYFESKEVLVETVYNRIYGKSLGAFALVDDPTKPLPQRFQILWMSVFRYCFEHPLEIAFLDQYENSPIAHRSKKSLPAENLSLKNLPVENLSVDELLAVLSKPDLHQQMTHEENTLYSLVVELRRENLIKDLPQAAIAEFSVGVPRRLARQASAGYLNLDKEALNAIADACWKAIAF